MSSYCMVARRRKSIPSSHSHGKNQTARFRQALHIAACPHFVLRREGDRYTAAQGEEGLKRQSGPTVIAPSDKDP